MSRALGRTVPASARFLVPESLWQGFDLRGPAKLKNSQPFPHVPFCFSRALLEARPPNPTDCCIVCGLNTIYILEQLRLD